MQTHAGPVLSSAEASFILYELGNGERLKVRARSLGLGKRKRVEYTRSPYFSFLDLSPFQCRSKGRGRGGPCPPPHFFSQKGQTGLYKMLKIKFYLPRGLKQ